MISRSLVFLGILVFACNLGNGADFQSEFDNTPDRVWVGADYWANPMEDWRIHDGRLECLSGGPGRNVHVLTHAVESAQHDFSVLAAFELIAESKKVGSVGIRLGSKDEIDDYRAAALRGRGLDVGITSDGVLFLGRKELKLDEPATSGELRLIATKNGPGGYALSLRLLREDGKVLAKLEDSAIKSDQVIGGVALIHNSRQTDAKMGPRFAFKSLRMIGNNITSYPDRAFGPILWAMHSLHHTPNGHVLKLTAQMAPIDDPASIVVLTIRGKTVGRTQIDPLSRTATFRITKWDGSVDTPYQLYYRLRRKKGVKPHKYDGMIRRDPTDKSSVSVAGFTGNQDYVFPNLEIAANVERHDPDVLFFSGDQIYEGVGGYGIIREPVDRAVLNYLRKWYLCGWAFGDLMRDRVTICLPDDHDVYQGNIWGEAGMKMPEGKTTSSGGGYRQHRDFVNAVHRTQCSHHPDFYDRTPIKQDISVFYGPMTYGGVSFAVIADRQFKSGPGHVADWQGRADHVRDPKYDVKKLDKPELQLLGRRQEKFLKEWVHDWYGANFKCVLSQTIFCNLANYHGGNQAFIFADLDSNGWPQTPRIRAIEIMRKGFALHYAGDQHLASIVHHGTDEFGDSGWSFCVPSIAAGYPRSWRPDEEGRAVHNRVNGPNTGDYLDAFGNKMTVWAVGNPAAKNRKGRVLTAQDKASGYGLVRFNHKDRTITMECWRLIADVTKPDDQFKGWPKTIDVTDNYGRKAAAYLPTIQVQGSADPVLQVIDERSGEIVYTLRIHGNRFKPKVFRPGNYTVRLSTDDGKKTERTGIKSVPDDDQQTIKIELP